MSQPEMAASQPVQPAPRRRTWLWVGGIGCGFVLLICCGVGGVMFYIGSKSMPSTDPAVINAARASIAEIEIPASMTPKISFNFEIPSVPHVIWTAFADNDSLLMLGEIKSENVTDAQRKQLTDQFEAILLGTGHQRETLKDQNSETQEFTIRDKPASFTFAKGTGASTDKETWDVTGTFAGKEGTGILVISAPVEKMDKEQITKIIQSIH